MSKLNRVACTLGIILVSGTIVFAQKICMFIGSAPGVENPGYDQYIIPQLEAWEYVVEKHYAHNLPTNSEADYTPYDFFCLSDTTHYNHMSPFKEIRKPMLCSDGWGAKQSSLAFFSDEQLGIPEPVQPVLILKEAEGSPLTAGYLPGTLLELGTILVCKDPCLIVWAKPSIPVIPVVGVESDPDCLVVYVVERKLLIQADRKSKTELQLSAYIPGDIR